MRTTLPNIIIQTHKLINLVIIEHGTAAGGERESERESEDPDGSTSEWFGVQACYGVPTHRFSTILQRIQ